MLASLLLLTLALVPIGPQGEVIRDNAEQRRAQGFLLLDGKWVEPQMSLAWSELLLFERSGSDVRLLPALSDELLERFKNNRRVLVTIGANKTPFQLRARRQWTEGRREEGVWMQLQSVPQPTDDASSWRIDSLHLSSSQLTLTATRDVDGLVHRHVISERRGSIFAAVTSEANQDRRGARQLGKVMLRDPRADLTALLADSDEALAWRSWEVLDMLSDAPTHPLRPLPGDLAEAEPEAALLSDVRGLLAEMVDRQSDVRNAASQALTALGDDALPAVLHLLDGKLLPEQRARLEAFVAQHGIYRDDTIDAERLRDMLDR